MNLEMNGMNGWIGPDLGPSINQGLAAEPVPAGTVNLFCDIETIPSGDPPRPEDIRPPSNYRDPQKILEYQNSKVDETFRSRALDPLQGEICCVGWAVEDGPVQTITLGLDVGIEAELFVKFTETVTGLGREIRWVGHNAELFDLPWLWTRSHLYGEPGARLRRLIPRRRYSTKVLDTMRVWGGPDSRNMTGLTALARFLGIGEKSGHGGQVWDLFQAGKFDEIASYCAADVELVRAVFHRIQGEISAPPEARGARFAPSAGLDTAKTQALIREFERQVTEAKATKKVRAQMRSMVRTIRDLCGYGPAPEVRP